MYFLANDSSVPDDIREKMSKWGLPKDEFIDNENWPHQLYIREARRMVGQVVMNENHLRALIPTPQSIGMGSYNMDSHNVQRYVDKNGHVRNEGDVQISPGGAYPISYLSITPKAKDCTNLLVPVCVSSSHIAYGSIRMEPVFMVLGQSAATAAIQAIENNQSVQEVDYKQLKATLLQDDQVLDFARKPRPVRVAINPKDLPGIVVDDVDAKREGTWTTSGSVSGFVGSGYLHDSNEGQGKKSIQFSAELEPGLYDVRIAYSANANRATNVPVVIRAGREVYRKELNQKKVPNIEKVFASVGQFLLGGKVSVTISNEGANGYVIADAVSFVPVEK